MTNMDKYVTLLFVTLPLITYANNHETREFKGFKKFKSIKHPHWHALQKHAYRDLTPVKQHKFRVSHKRSDHVSTPNKLQQNRRTFANQLSKALENANVSVENHVHSQSFKSQVTSPQHQTRSFLDSLKGANVSIENHVHSQASKSKIGHSSKGSSTRSVLLNAIRNANISVENSVHSYTARRRHLHKKRFDLGNALKNAIFSVQNSVHSYTARRRHTLKNNVLPTYPVKKSLDKHTITRENLTKKHAFADLASALKNANVSIQNSVHSYTVNKRMHRPHITVIDVSAHKRDEEPFDDNGVQLKGKSAMEVAAEIESNDKNFIPMLSSTSSNGLKKDTEEALEGRLPNNNEKHHHHSEEQPEEKPEYIISDKADAFDEYQTEHPKHKKTTERENSHERHDEREYARESHHDDNQNENEHDSYPEKERQHHKERNDDQDEQDRHELPHENAKYKPTEVQSFNGGQHEEVEDEVSTHHTHEEAHEHTSHHGNLIEDNKPSDYHETSSFSKDRDATDDHEQSSANSREEEQHEEDKAPPERESHDDEDRPKQDYENDEREPPEHAEEPNQSNTEADQDNESTHESHESDRGNEEVQRSESPRQENHEDNSESRNESPMKMFDSKSNFVDQMRNMEGHSRFRDEDNTKSFDAPNDCEERRHGVCKDTGGQLPDRRQLDLDTNKPLTERQKMIEFQRNPFDPHDNIDLTRHDGDDPHHEAINSPIPQSVLQIAVDPSVNLHYLSRTEHQDMHDSANPHPGNNMVSPFQGQDLHDSGNAHSGHDMISPFQGQDLHDSGNAHQGHDSISPFQGQDLHDSGNAHPGHNMVSPFLGQDIAEKGMSKPEEQRFASDPHVNAMPNWDYQRDAPREPREESPFNHHQHDEIHRTSDNGHFDFPKSNGQEHLLPQAMMLEKEPSEHEKTYPATPQQQPLMPMFTPPERQLPMFQVGHPHDSPDTQEGARRSTNTLNSGQVYEFGDRDYANYLHSHLSEYLKQAAYDYSVMGLESPNLGIENEIARRRKLENDAQVVLNETEILKQLHDNSSDLLIFDAKNATKDQNNSTLVNNTNTLTTGNTTGLNNNNSSTIDSKSVRKHLIPETSKLKNLMIETAQSLAEELGKRSKVQNNKKSISNNKSEFFIPGDQQNVEGS